MGLLEADWLPNFAELRRPRYRADRSGRGFILEESGDSRNGSVNSVRSGNYSVRTGNDSAYSKSYSVWSGNNSGLIRTDLRMHSARSWN